MAGLIETFPLKRNQDGKIVDWRIRFRADLQVKSLGLGYFPGSPKATIVVGDGSGQVRSLSPTASEAFSGTRQ